MKDEIKTVHIHTPCCPQYGRWKRFWSFFSHECQFDTKTMTAKCSICGKMIEASPKILRYRALMLSSSYLFYLLSVFFSHTNRTISISFSVVWLAALGFTLFFSDSFLLAVLPWQEIPPELPLATYLKIKETHLHENNLTGLLLVSTFTLWLIATDLL